MTDLKRASNGHIEDTRRAVAAHEIQIDATAGCPRNCSEALIKDVGFVAIGDVTADQVARPRWRRP
jgi:dissimilatory sulfite reductase (desulfoviridin) alpha/beta subunit